MDIHPLTSEPATWDITTDLDPAAATAQVYIGGAWRDLAWTGAATQDATAGTWTREALLVVRGADATAGTLVTAADSRPLTKVVLGGYTFERRSTQQFALRT